jgi:hypothetical protein
VELKAKAGKEEEVAIFLKSAEPLIDEEVRTVAWFSVRFDKSTFAIFDAFDTETGREGRLGGEVAAALMAHAGELLESSPQIRKADVLADKLPA